jgi:hypothetical protein
MALREEVGAMSRARGIVTAGVVGLAVLGGPVADSPAGGVTVIQAQFGLPPGGPDAPGQCGGSDALQALVVRSLVQAVSETAETTNGAADLSPVEGQAVGRG